VAKQLHYNCSFNKVIPKPRNLEIGPQQECVAT